MNEKLEISHAYMFGFVFFKIKKKEKKKPTSFYAVLAKGQL